MKPTRSRAPAGIVTFGRVAGAGGAIVAAQRCAAMSWACASQGIDSSGNGLTV